MWEVSVLDPGCQSVYRRGDLNSKHSYTVSEVSGSGPSCQSGYRSGDLGRYDTPMWEISSLSEWLQEW